MAKSDSRQYEVKVEAVAPITRTGTLISQNEHSTVLHYRRRGSSKHNTIRIAAGRLIASHGDVGGEANVTSMETIVVASFVGTFVSETATHATYQTDDGEVTVATATADIQCVNDEEASARKSKKSARKGKAAKSSKSDKAKGKGKKGKGKKGKK